MAKWLKGKGPDSDIVISSRVRLARNLENTSFSQRMNDEEANVVKQQVKDAILNGNSVISKDFNYFNIENIDLLNRRILVEKHIISPGLLEKPDKSAFLISKDEKVTVMMNEEDHVRIQVLNPGLSLEESWDLCSKIDDLLDENLKYAFDDKFGYITACPTNVGTGLRASVMLHLPALVLTNYINKILQAVSQIGLTVRGLYGEGTDVMGNLFQISNQTTLGKTEEEIIEKLKNIVMQIIDKERASRESLFNNQGIRIEDKIYRSLGILRNSRIITSKEAMDLLSFVRMGIDMGIIKDVNIDVVNNLMITTQPANIQKYAKSELSSQERDVKRAELIREKL
ncbi:protein arginine kinase [Sporosalibacterium faouarense]|uniref:protein arginine kinase n=1 Tax=Sporosalibacterium faouarense TaxID=516123 RepID=UPI00192BF1AE